VPKIEASVEVIGGALNTSFKVNRFGTELYYAILHEDWYSKLVSPQAVDFYLYSDARYILRAANELNNASLLLGQQINNLEDDLREKFMARDVKMYYDDFDNIPDTEEYTYETSFTARNLLLAYANQWSGLILDRQERYRYVKSYILANSLNGLPIKNLEEPEILREDVDSKVE